MTGDPAPQYLLGPDIIDMDTTELDEVVQIFLEDADAERKAYEELERKRKAAEENR